MTTIKIDEFSTGIKAAGSFENWYSQGFTGEYMNRSIAEIPAAVQKAISNRLFAVAEGGSSDQATLIGREVLNEDQDKAWSVLAVVTRGRDEWQRPFSAHRYFICDEEDNLPNLFKFWNENKLVFNPFDIKNVGDFVEYTVETGNISSQNLSEEHREFLQQKAPIIFPYNIVMPPLIIDCIATAKAEKDGDPVSWAYQVEALEHPRTFKAIFPASEQAEQILRRVVASQPQVDRFVQDEPAIKKAISLLSQNKVKPEHLKTIEDALSNPVIDDKYWRSMFDSQGASTAIKESSYSPQLVRLLTLRAMVIPETLPQFFDWLNKKDSKDQIWTECLDFQAKITKSLLNLPNLPNLKSSLLKGIKFMMLQLLNSETYIKNTAWLCTAEGGCWANIYKSVFRQDLKDKLKNLNAPNLSPSSIPPGEWDKALDKVMEHLQKRKHYLLKEYFVLANFFFMAKNYRLATIFYHVSAGDIPPELFKKLKSNHPDYADIYGIRVYRKIGTAEKIGGFIVPVYLFVPALITVAILGYFGGNLFIKSDAEKAINQTVEYVDEKINPNSPNLQDTRQKLLAGLEKEKLKKEKALSKGLVCMINNTFTGEYYCDLPQNIAEGGIAKFGNTTVKNINQIKQELSNQKNPERAIPFENEKQKDQWLAKQLKIDSSILQKAVNVGQDDIIQKNELIYAIYKYQKQNNLKETGILDDATKKKIMEKFNTTPKS